jgi:hypothetical protein
MATERDLIADALDQFDEAQSHWADQREATRVDMRFCWLGDQWDQRIREQRQKDARPCLTLNRMPSFVRQVTNDQRQNKPSIKVRPVDDKADPAVAEIYNGLFRHIEANSSAQVSYDTACEHQVSGGMGFWRVDIDYARNDAFDLDLLIKRIPDPLSVLWDAHSTAHDSSDWNYCFLTDRISEDAFKKRFPSAKKSDFRALNLRQGWWDDQGVQIAEWWTREETKVELLQLADGRVIEADERKAKRNRGIAVVKSRKDVPRFKVTHRIISGAEVLEETAWIGQYIPVIPCWGQEVTVEGKRYFLSLVRDVQDAQRMYNYWRTAATEMIALAPKPKWLGPKGAFKTDKERWARANVSSDATLEYDGSVAPIFQTFDSSRVGEIQQGLAAADDMKAITGIYDASLGAKSNETSGRAIMARQREGDTATFHFIDNLTRAIEHTARVMLDLIPKIYDEPRIVRILGEDGTAAPIPINQPVQLPGPNGLPIEKVFDLSVGTYDLVVTAGPNFTTKRAEAAQGMLEFVQRVPNAAAALGDLIAKAQDWPDADEVAERLQKLLPPQLQGQAQPDPAAAMAAQMQQQQAALAAEQAAAQQKLAMEIQLKREAQQADFALKREAAEQEIALERYKAQLKAQTDVTVATMEIKADVAKEAMRPPPMQAADPMMNQPA